MVTPSKTSPVPTSRRVVDAGSVDSDCGGPVGEIEILAQWGAGSVNSDGIEKFLRGLRDLGRAASTRNQYLQVFKAMSTWGFRKGYLEHPWIGPFADLKREKIARRRGKVTPDEEKLLLAAAPPRLQRLIIAALETGCRQGEILSLQWREVDLIRREIRIRADKAKDDEDRHIPVSNRMLAVLEMASQDPTGHPFRPTAYVFGDEVGHRVGSPKKAWETAVLKAHGHRPVWQKKANRLADESREAYRAVNLHFHDFRHEAGSRWLEAGMPLHHVKELLSHANISTTDTYLNAGRIHLHESMRKVDERGNILHKVCTNVPAEPSLLCNVEPIRPANPLIN